MTSPLVGGLPKQWTALDSRSCRGVLAAWTTNRKQRTEKAIPLGLVNILDRGSSTPTSGFINSDISPLRYPRFTYLLGSSPDSGDPSCTSPVSSAYEASLSASDQHKPALSLGNKACFHQTNHVHLERRIDPPTWQDSYSSHSFDIRNCLHTLWL